MGTVTPDEFMKLRSGDIVLWKGRRLRTVLAGPADGRHGSIELPILRRSWCDRPTTVMDKSMCSDLEFTGKRRGGLASKAECLALARSGFSRESFLAELADQQAIQKRMERHRKAQGRPLDPIPKRVPRILGATETETP